MPYSLLFFSFHSSHRCSRRLVKTLHKLNHSVRIYIVILFSFKLSRIDLLFFFSHCSLLRLVMFCVKMFISFFCILRIFIFSFSFVCCFFFVRLYFFFLCKCIALTVYIPYCNKLSLASLSVFLAKQ